MTTLRQAAAGSNSPCLTTVKIVLTHRGIQSADLPENRPGPTAILRGHPFDRHCKSHPRFFDISPTSFRHATSSNGWRPSSASPLRVRLQAMGNRAGTIQTEAAPENARLNAWRSARPAPAGRSLRRAGAAACFVLQPRQVDDRILIEEACGHQLEPTRDAGLDRMILRPRQMVQTEAVP